MCHTTHGEPPSGCLSCSTPLHASRVPFPLTSSSSRVDLMSMIWHQPIMLHGDDDPLKVAAQVDHLLDLDGGYCEAVSDLLRGELRG